MLEKLSKIAHESWAGWTKYFFEKGKRNEDGTITIPKWAVERWERQIKTDYKDLTEKEKGSDREEAIEYLHEMTKDYTFAKNYMENVKNSFCKKFNMNFCTWEENVALFDDCKFFMSLENMIKYNKQNMTKHDLMEIIGRY